MADKNVQLHKKGDSSEKWFPTTEAKYVHLTDYRKYTSKSPITDLSSETVSSALGKLEYKVDLLDSAYRIMGSTSSLPTISNSAQKPDGCEVGYVWNLTNDITIGTGSGMRTDFVESAEAGTKGKKINKGSNVVFIDTTPLASTRNYKWDVLGMVVSTFSGIGTSGLVPAPSSGDTDKYLKSDGTWATVSGGGSGGVNTATKNQVAVYSDATTVGGSTKLTFNGSVLSVNGSVSATGSVTALASSSSDKRLKKDIGSFSALDIIGKLNPVQFKWNDTARAINDEFKDGVNYGLIAQDSEGVMDNLVFDLPILGDYKGVRYEKLIPVLLKAVKEQQEEINELRKLIKK